MGVGPGRGGATVLKLVVNNDANKQTAYGEHFSVEGANGSAEHDGESGGLSAPPDGSATVPDGPDHGSSA
jgi:hypothetical protein